MTKLNLSEKSKNYYEENDIYELFSIAEDYPNKIYKYLLPKIKNKTIFLRTNLNKTKNEKKSTFITGLRGVVFYGLR